MITIKQAKQLIDNVIIATNTIQYTRQATYYLLLANGATPKTLTKLILDRAKVNKTSIARGALVNEIRVAQYCIDKQAISAVFANNETLSDMVNVIAKQMTDKKLSYYFLFDKRKKADKQADKQADKSSKQEKALDLNRVIEYIKQADKQALDLIKQALDARQADSTSSQASKPTSKKASKAASIAA